MPDADTYLIQSGHRRKRAAAMAKLKTVPVVVLEWVDDSDVRKRNLVDSNLFNRHKDPMTIARELDAYRSTFPGEKEKDIVEMMANHYGYSISTIRRHLYLLKLIPELQEKVQQPDLYSMAGILEGRSMTAEQQLEFNQMIDDFVKEKGINALTKEVIIRMARNMKRPEKTSTYTMQEMIGNFISKCKKYESQDEELYYHTLLETREEIEKLIEAYEKK